ncbi:hypothetical protein BX070DRAFT_258129, partial [Coemansia spiralis]
RVSEIINQQEADARLARGLQKKYGENLAFVLGYWLALVNKFHDPIRDTRM